MNNIKEKFKLAFLLFAQFFKIGAVTFGGGLAMLPILQRDLVDKKSWLTDEELIDYFAIGQSTPGIIAVNVATFVGYKKLGVLGAVISTIAIVLPSVIVITTIAIFTSYFLESAFIQKALKGINVVVSVLLLKAVINLGKKTLHDVFAYVIALTAFFLAIFFQIKTFWIILISACLGLLIQMRRSKNHL